MAANPDSNDEIKDKIHFVIQGSSDMGNVTIAVAVGLFGILSIFTLLQTSGGTYLGQLGWYMRGSWTLVVFIVLSLAYWGVSVLGFACIVYRRHYEALFDYYMTKRYPGYDVECREIAKFSPILSTTVLIDRRRKEYKIGSPIQVDH
jgi:hypothetical protein